MTVRSKSARGRHPKIIIMDDPVTEEDDSPAARKAAQKLYNELHKLTDNILVIGQPVHKLDLYGKLRNILLKLEIPHGSIPELDHDLDAQRAAGVTEESIQASYFLKVVSENPTPFENISMIDDYPLGPSTSSVAFVDPSFKGGDYTALTIATAHFDGVAIHGRVFKKAWNHCIKEIVDELIKFKVARLGFETNSLGDMPINLIRQELPAGIGITGRTTVSEKHGRIMNAGVFAEKIFMSRKSDKIYQDQVIEYEYGADHDDAPDSLASLLEWIGLIRNKRKK